MYAILAVISSVDFWEFALPLLGAILAWYINEWRKRLADQYQRKEANYKELLRSVRGFYVGASNADELRREFLNQLSIAWLYCPDDVIKKGYAFLDTVSTERISSEIEKELALGAFVAATRSDLLSRKLVKKTKLTPADFRHLGINNL